MIGITNDDAQLCLLRDLCWDAPPLDARNDDDDALNSARIAIMI